MSMDDAKALIAALKTDHDATYQDVAGKPDVKAHQQAHDKTNVALQALPDAVEAAIGNATASLVEAEGWTYEGEWDAAATYAPRSAVARNDVVYVSHQQTTGDDPEVGGPWFPLPTAADVSARSQVADLRVGQGFLPLTNPTLTALGTDPRALDVIGGVLYGRVGQTLYRKPTSGAAWTLVQEIMTGAGTIEGIRALEDGEVLVIRRNVLLKSNGWDPQAGAQSWTQVRATHGASYFLPWGVDVAGPYVIATTYIAGSGSWEPSRYVWLSDDHAATFGVAYEKNDSGTHFHLAALDPFVPGMAHPRLWTMWHGEPGAASGASTGQNTERELLYSDDLGTTWTVLSTAYQPTTGCATDRGMVFGSDDTIFNGIYTVPHDTMKVTEAWEWRTPLSGLIGFGWRAFRDPATGLVYTGFRPSQGDTTAGVVAVSDGRRASEVWRDTKRSYVDNVVVHDGRVVGVVRDDAGDFETLRAETVVRGAPQVQSFDTGQLLGGVARKPVRAVAAGLGSLAADRSVAVGVEAATTEPGQAQVAVGFRALAGGSNAVAVGADAKANFGNTVAIGKDAAVSGAGATAVGYQAVSAGTSVAFGTGAESRLHGTVIGHNAKHVAGSFAVVVGRLAEGRASTVAIGYQAIPSGNNAVVLGASASSVADGIAIGEGASVGNVGSVAIGRGTATTATGQVAVGERDVEVQSSTRGLILRRPDGGRRRVTVNDLDELVVSTP